VQAVDWWSVGVLTYELLTGASPFTVEGEKNTQQEISKRILNCEPPMPDFLGRDVSDFILRLLVKDPRKRMGGGPGDAEEVKAHRFFATINWDDLLQRNIPAPFIPRISGATDTSNFSEEFTSMAALDSPGIVPPNVEKVFKGYSFVAPSVLFSENLISDDIFKPSPEKRPSVSNLVGMKIKNSPFFQKYRIDFKEKILGDGSFSVCRRCVLLSTEAEYAVKIVSRRVDATNEIRLLQLCQGHPGVVQLVEVIQDLCHTYIVTELLRGGELLARIKSRQRFTESEAAAIMSQLVSVVGYIHAMGVVHRDLKPENLLFSSTADTAQIKVVDFGFARLKPELESGMLTPCFTLPYAAPEVITIPILLSLRIAHFFI
jgi:ribosomal protein S6 kinase alpha-5